MVMTIPDERMIVMTKEKHHQAQERMNLIAPFLAPGLDRATYQKMKDQISRKPACQNAPCAGTLPDTRRKAMTD